MFLTPCCETTRLRLFAASPFAPRPSLAPPRPGHSWLCRTTLYDLLGVAQTATPAEIKTAYRQAAAAYHPDVNPSQAAHEKFQVINSAADVLTCPELRDQYDRQGLAALPASHYKILHDYIKRVRAGGVAVLQSEPGGDISTVLGLEFNEAVTGAACTVTTGALGTCPDCKGSGFDAGEGQAADCSVCSGSGEIVVTKWQHAGAPRLPELLLCPACKGSGRAALNQCGRCNGDGRIQIRRHVRIKVPAGVSDGQVLRVKGQGHMGKQGGAPGDLLVRLQVYDLGDVLRQGDDLYSQVNLGLWEALLGGEVEVHTVRGRRNLAVPQGTQHGQLLCVRGAGVARPSVNGVEYGNHYFEVLLQVPDSQAAGPAEMELLQKLAAVVKEQRGLGSLQQQ